MRTLEFKQTFHYLFFVIKILLRTLGWRCAERLVKPSPDSDSATWIFREVELRFGNEARNKLWFWFGERKRKSCRFHRALQIQIRPSDPRVGGDARIETRVSSRVSHEERRRRRKKDASSNDQIFFPPTPLLALFPRFTRLAFGRETTADGHTQQKVEKRTRKRSGSTFFTDHRNSWRFSYFKNKMYFQV